MILRRLLKNLKELVVGGAGDGALGFKGELRIRLLKKAKF